MPFTPFHMGPGMLIKSLLHGSFSLMIFGWSQILMDLQPLFAMITNEDKLHGFSHTFLGASFIAIIAVLTGKHLSEFGLRITGYSNRNKPIKIIWFVAFFSAFIGTYSHVVLDAIMHSDVDPYYPFNMTNNFLSILPVQLLHEFCIYSGVIGGGIFYFIQYLWKPD